MTNYISATETVTSSQCDFCKIDIYATALVFPTAYVTTTISATTEDVYKTVYDDINSTVYSTSTHFAPTTCSKTPVTTWEQFGVVLTYPTTYLAYTNFSRGFLEPRPTVFGCGELVSVPLDLGPSATDFAELIIATTAIPTTTVPAPAQLLAYMDTIQTVVAQLPPGVPASSCDTPNLVTVATPAPVQTATLTETAQGVKKRNQPVEHTVMSAILAALAASTTRAVVSISTVCSRHGKLTYSK
jgi:hypothetical protein